MQKLYVKTPPFPLYRICFSRFLFVLTSTSILNLLLGYIFTFWFKYIWNVSVSLLIL